MLPKIVVIAPGVDRAAAARLRELAKRAGVEVMDAANEDAHIAVATHASHLAVEAALLWAALRKAESRPQALGVPLFLPRALKGATFEVLAPLTRDNQPIRDAGFQPGDHVTFDNAPVGWIAYSVQARAAVVDPWQFVRAVKQPQQGEETEVEAKLSDLYPMTQHPTAAARAGCPGGPIAWVASAGGYVCYYCRMMWDECVGIAKRGKALHAGCSKASMTVHAFGAPFCALVTCSDCGQAWAPFPRHREALACDHASQAARAGLLHRNAHATKEAEAEHMLSARVAACAAFGGFVHGDEGLGCWRCGAVRQVHS